MSSVPPEAGITKPQDPADRVAAFHLLGHIAWEDAWALQRRLVYEASGEVNPRLTVLLCEHPQLITVGRNGSRIHVRMTDEQLRRERLSIRWVGRGGGCVLHLPGQLCIYPIVPLRQNTWTVGEFVHRFQQGLTDALNDLNIRTTSHDQLAGLWGRSGLLAALGIAVQNWVTCHGAFLNVIPAMSRYSFVDAVAAENVPAGAKPSMGSLLAERRLAVRMTGVRASLVSALSAAFSCARYHIHTGHPLLPQRSDRRRESIARAS